jgi:hypothetical protein
MISRRHPGAGDETCLCLPLALTSLACAGRGTGRTGSPRGPSRVVEPAARGGLAVGMSGPVEGRARLCGKDDRIDGASVTERLELCSRAETENA